MKMLGLDKRDIDFIRRLPFEVFKSRFSMIHNISGKLVLNEVWCCDQAIQLCKADSSLLGELYNSGIISNTYIDGKAVKDIFTELYNSSLFVDSRIFNALHRNISIEKDTIYDIINSIRNTTEAYVSLSIHAYEQLLDKKELVWVSNLYNTWVCNKYNVDILISNNTVSSIKVYTYEKQEKDLTEYYIKRLRVLKQDGNNIQVIKEVGECCIQSVETGICNMYNQCETTISIYSVQSGLKAALVKYVSDSVRIMVYNMRGRY